MEHIEYFDLIHSNPNKRRDVVNEEWTIYDAYESSVAASSPILNFYKIINDNEVPKLVELMRNFWNRRILNKLCVTNFTKYTNGILQSRLHNYWYGRNTHTEYIAV